MKEIPLNRVLLTQSGQNMTQRTFVMTKIIQIQFEVILAKSS